MNWCFSLNCDLFFVKESISEDSANSILLHFRFNLKISFSVTHFWKVKCPSNNLNFYIAFGSPHFKQSFNGVFSTK